MKRSRYIFLAAPVTAAVRAGFVLEGRAPAGIGAGGRQVSRLVLPHLLVASFELLHLRLLFGGQFVGGVPIAELHHVLGVES